MTNYSEFQAPDPSNISQGNSNLLTPGSLAQISQDLQRSVQDDLAGIRAETEKLRSRSNFVICMLIAWVLIFGGISAWLTIRLLAFEQAPKSSTINAELSETELSSRVETLEQELKTLKKFDSSTLIEEVQNNQEQLQKVVQQVRRLSTDIQAVNGSNENPDVSNRRPDPSPEAQSQPTPSEPTPSEPAQSTQPRVSP